ncbi:MAG: DUF2807 domain-containing protein [Candidatus Cloacimonetes bacterium]|nr:DUF2807 domain-containing protein [Candidatus Cloacimonadota bacterium]HPM01067.1 DUF2807 domain-containing protein [Candidatus Cloacimonadota bacterium]
MLKRYAIIISLIAILLFSLNLLAQNNKTEEEKTVQESNKAIPELLSVNEVELTGTYTVNIEQSNTPKLSIKGKRKNELNVYIEGNRLYIEHKKGKKKVNMFKDSEIEVNLNLKEIKEIKINGVASMQNIRPINGNRLKIELNGVGSIELSKLDFNHIHSAVNGTGSVELSGKTNTLALYLNGVGSIDTQNLKAYKCRAENDGLGSISLYAETELDAYIGGLGSIEYMGNPKVHKEINGLGSISRIE